MEASTLPRRRGRPSANRPAAREQILDALIRVLESAPLGRPSLRDVARAASVTPALLHYHFADLPGLMRSLHQDRAQPLLQPLLEDLIRGQSAAGPALARFVQKWTALGMRHRWLAACLLQTTADAGAVAEGLGGIVRRAVAAAQQQGTVRRDLPDGYIALLLLSLGVMPHLAQTALVTAADAPALADPQRCVELTLQHLAVLQSGVAR